MSLMRERTGSWWMMAKKVPEALDGALGPAHERRREVEAEAVDVHLGHPVAQAVHDELERLRVRERRACCRSR